MTFWLIVTNCLWLVVVLVMIIFWFCLHLSRRVCLILQYWYPYFFYYCDQYNFDSHELFDIQLSLLAIFLISCVYCQARLQKHLMLNQNPQSLKWNKALKDAPWKPTPQGWRKTRKESWRRRDEKKNWKKLGKEFAICCVQPLYCIRATLHTAFRKRLTLKIAKPKMQAVIPLWEH